MYIVTGGAGFIGSALIAYMNSKGIDDIIVVDRLADEDKCDSPKWKNLIRLRFADYIEADDFNRIKNGIKAEALVHLGACSSTTVKDPVYTIKNNFEFSKEMWLYAKSKGMYFIYASSAATYGMGDMGFNDDDDLHYLQRLRPLNLYGFSKHMFDLWMAGQGALKEAAGVKYFNVFGPNEYHKADMASMVYKSFKKLQKDILLANVEQGKGRVSSDETTFEAKQRLNDASKAGTLFLFSSNRSDYKDGEQKRDFVYIKDAVAMTYFLIEKRAAGLFNAGTGKARTWNDLAKSVFNACNMPQKIEYIDMPLDVARHYQYFTEAKMDKIGALGYPVKKIWPLESAVEDYIQKYLMPSRFLSDDLYDL